MVIHNKRYKNVTKLN